MARGADDAGAVARRRGRRRVPDGHPAAARGRPIHHGAVLAGLRIIRHVPGLRRPGPPIQGAGRAARTGRSGVVNRGDRALLLLPLALTAIGVIMVYSSSAILGITRFQDPDYFFTRQLTRALLGVAAMLVCVKLRLRLLEA